MRTMSNSMSRKERAEVFAARVRKVHGNRYKILGEYTTSNSPLRVLCRKHGEFSTTPKRFAVRGQGCPVCAVQTRKHNTTKTRRLQQYDRAKAHAKVMNWMVVTSREEYAAVGGKCELKCFCGYSWAQTPKVIVKAKRCRVCANREVNKTKHIPLEKRLAAIEFVHDGTILVVDHDGEYGAFECRVCGSLWRAKLFLVASGSSCKSCTLRRITHSPKRIHYAITLCGKTHYVVGYEANAIRALLKSGKASEDEINLNPPIFTYRLEGKTRRYLPDFQVRDIIVEVKSPATAGLIDNVRFASFKSLKAKARAVINAGFRFNLVLMDGKRRIRLPEDWLQMTRSQVIGFIRRQESNVRVGR